MSSKRAHLFIFILLICQISGCATWAQHGVSASHDKKFRIAVLPIDVTSEISTPSDIMSSPPEVDDEKKFVQEQMKIVGEQLTRALNARLDKSGYVEIVAIDPSAAQTMIQARTSTQVWSAEQLGKLKIDDDVQAVLLVQLSGYGKMKKKWLAYMIGSGVVEGVVQGVLAAKLVNNTWVGVALALEEIGQEVLVWGGGSYLFNEYFVPVTVEAQLISTRDGKPMWDDTVFVSVDKKAIEKLPEADQKKKELQLQLTAKKALNELVDDLEEAAKRNVGVQDTFQGESDSPFGDDLLAP